jgi:DNA-directed RNA polymerase I subunit RPA12
LPQLNVVTRSYPKPTPEWLLEYRALLAAKKGAGEAKKKRATVDEECPKCKSPHMEYYTMQLRSADEGQTVFYECPACGHTFSVNT